MSFKNARFVKSFLNMSDIPDKQLPEIGFVGRSNVGKSSLINHLLQRKNFARVSKQPGKTRTLNFFSIDERFYLVDLPGYGYAKISKSEQKKWQQAIEKYLLNSENLAHLFVLVDSKVGPKESDLQMVEWLQHHEIPYSIIATKIDKVPKTKRNGQIALIKKIMSLSDTDQLLPFSIRDQNGRQKLVAVIRSILD